MNSNSKLIEKWRKKFLVSCQAADGDIFYGPDLMMRFAVAAQEGGAAGIRANGAEDIRAIRKAIDLPLIGINKTPLPEGGWLITGSFEEACHLVEAGADIIAMDCSVRGQRRGALERIREIKTLLNVPVMADIATLEEALAAEEAGADLVATTLRGYTPETSHIQALDLPFIQALVHKLKVPLVSEGRIATPEQARETLRLGAFAVIVGTAVTCPREITRRFADLIELDQMQTAERQYFLGIDLGGTNTKWGVVSQTGELLESAVVPTPAGGGRAVLLDHLKGVAQQALHSAQQKGIAPSALGIATAGWVDHLSGRVAYATENLPGWTGTPIAAELESATGLPVAVENDANALALAEKQFGSGKNVSDFVCITLGTGIGGGCIMEGRLHRGPHYFANALGHITLVPEGIPCTCGKRGCLEAYANATALLRYAGSRYLKAEEVIGAANRGVPEAACAIETMAGHLAAGLASIIHVLDPEMVILSGGITENNPLLLQYFQQELQSLVSVWELRKIQIQVSQLGYYGGVLGAVAALMEKLERDATTQYQLSMQSPTSFTSPVPGK
jgi:glucokinase-like ROK family protein